MDNARRPGLLVGLLVMLLHEPALASSDLRHRIICEIPFQELGPKPRDRVKELIRRDRDFATLRPAAGPTIAGVEHRSTTSTCPATPKISKRTLAPWLPSASSRRFAKDLAVLSLSSATEQQRLEALKYIGHWVGDNHQPLHVAFEDDRGGDEVGVSGGLCSWPARGVGQLHHRARPAR